MVTVAAIYMVGLVVGRALFPHDLLKAYAARPGSS